MRSLSCVYQVKVSTEMMRIETITYKRTKNLGNFQSESMEVIATLEEEDLPEDVAENLKLFIRNQLYPPIPDIPDISDHTVAAPDSF